MRQVGSRKESLPNLLASGASLIAGAEFGMTISNLTGGSSFVPKGLYRFKTHEDAAKKDQEWLAKGMGKIALERKHG